MLHPFAQYTAFCNLYRFTWDGTSVQAVCLASDATYDDAVAAFDADLRQQPDLDACRWVQTREEALCAPVYHAGLPPWAFDFVGVTYTITRDIYPVSP